jgi:hypothetical protein
MNMYSHLEIEALAHGGYVIRETGLRGLDSNFYPQLVAVTTLCEALDWISNHMVQHTKESPDELEAVLRKFIGLSTFPSDG